MAGTRDRQEPDSFLLTAFTFGGRLFSGGDDNAHQKTVNKPSLRKKHSENRFHLVACLTTQQSQTGAET